MKRCEPGDLPGILEFYRLVSDETAHVSEFARWIYGKHPTEDMIRDFVLNGYMFCLKEGGVIVSAVAVTPFQTEDYHGVNWEIQLEDDEVAVVHLLAVNPRFQRSGTARAVMKDIISDAKDSGKRAVRLDALKSNTPAHRLYESLGFKHRATCHWYAANTGWTDFYLFEHLL